jgi:hypothetical protein
MHRSDFGAWAAHLDESTYWRALAVLGMLNAWQVPPPRPDAMPDDLLEVALAGLPQGGLLSEIGGPMWLADDDYKFAAREGRLIAAEKLAHLFLQLLRTQRMPPRLESLALYENDREITDGFDRHLGLAYYHRLRQEAPGDDWQWPLRFAFPPSTDEDGGMREAFVEAWHGSQTMLRLTRHRDLDDGPVVEFVVLTGSIADAIHQVESASVPFRAHVVLIVDSSPVEPNTASYDAIERLQTLVFAKAIVMSAVPAERFGAWIHSVVVELSHNAPIDWVVNRASFVQDVAYPTMFFDPSVFGSARIGAFARQTQAMLHRAASSPVDLAQDEAEPIGLSAGRFDAADVSRKLEATLAQPDAFDEERRGATWTTRLLSAAASSGALQSARRNRSAHELPAAERRVQVTVTDEGEPTHHFRADRQHGIEVSVGAIAGMLGAGQAFPDELLPGDEDGHLLTVTLNAPGFQDGPQLRTVYLPRRGDSTPCQFAIKTDRQQNRFEARIGIAYRNRTLQTFLLTGSVIRGPAPDAKDEPVVLTLEMATQAGLDELDDQQAYGATLIVNQLGGKKSATVQAGYDVLPFSLDQVEKTTMDIESEMDASKWDSPQMSGLASAGSQKLLHFLSFSGASLWAAVAECAANNAAGQRLLDRLAGAQLVQVLSANEGARLPVEFFYDGIGPSSKAVICPSHSEAIGLQECRSCPNHNSGHFCPARLWSLQRCIEWHQFTDAKQRKEELERRDFAIESPRTGTRRNRLRPITDIVVGYSPKAVTVEKSCVDDMKASLERLDVHVHVGANWIDVASLLVKKKPALLLLLSHTTKGNLGQACLEIGGELFDEADIRALDLGAAADEAGTIVLLIGCNTDNAGTSYNSFPVLFSRRRASVVVSTITHLLGRYAAPLAADIAAELIAGQRQKTLVRFSQAMQNVRRRGLRAGWPPVTLSLKCYGDARWWL